MVKHLPFTIKKNFLSYVSSLVLFKILVQICKIISGVRTLFNDNINHNKICEDTSAETQ
jgi:hypothetical protein